MWDRKRNKIVEAGEFSSTGRICNPGKYFILQLVKEVVDELNSRTIGNFLWLESILSCVDLYRVKTECVTCRS